MDEKILDFSNGSFMVYKKGKRHSENGPAFLSPWSIAWYLDGEIMLPEEWRKSTNKTPEEMNAIVEKYKEYQRTILTEYILTRR